MDPMYLPEIEENEADGQLGKRMADMREQGVPIPQIWHLFAFKPHLGDALSELTQQVMRGPSPLSAGLRELIAAFTSSQNQCLF